MVAHQCIQETNIALLQQTMKNIESKLDNVDTKMDNFIKEIRENYATKKDLDNTKSEIDWLKNKLWSLTFYILCAVIWGILTVFLTK
jgi:polyhydroxyalkanoate synthesis regulator phasin